MLRRYNWLACRVLRDLASVPLRTLGKAQRAALQKLTASMVSEIELPGGNNAASLLRLRFCRRAQTRPYRRSPTPSGGSSTSSLAMYSGTLARMWAFSVSTLLCGAECTCWPSSRLRTITWRFARIRHQRSRRAHHPLLRRPCGQHRLGLLNLASQDMGAAPASIWTPGRNFALLDRRK